MQGSERPNPPTHAYRHRGGGREEIVRPRRTDTGPENFKILANRDTLLDILNLSDYFLDSSASFWATDTRARI